jgi:hypothetical protein
MQQDGQLYMQQDGQLYMQQDGQRDRSLRRSFVRDFFRQIALRFDEQTFFHNAFVFFDARLTQQHEICRNDVVIAVAASGTTPFTFEAVRREFT